MAVKVGINGYGRIGRNVLRSLYESGRTDEVQIVAVNDLGDAETNAHLTRHDTAHGPFPGTVAVEGGDLVVNGDHIKCLSEKDPSNIPLGDMGVDVVMECTGIFTQGEKAKLHLDGGAKKVIISAPAKGDIDGTVVYGVNHKTLKADHKIISNASCTTNCMAPVVKPLHDKIGVDHGLMTTIHSFTNDQVLSDVYHSDLRRARAAGHNQIPAKTGAAAAVGLVLPELRGKLDGFAIRVPTINVSLVDFTFQASRETSVDEVNKVMKEASESGELQGILGYNEEPLVSSDFNHDQRSSIFDATQTRIQAGNFVKVCSWYDNEWGFSSRMIDVAIAMMSAK